MFTGIVEGTATVVSLEPAAQGRRLLVQGLPEGLSPGQSIALNGACLTVVEESADTARFDLAGETLRCTSLGDLVPGSLLNYERALKIGDRLDGHVVQGHVDGTGVVRGFEPAGEDWWLEVEAAGDLLGQVLHKGSITVDGISLTVAKLDSDAFACTIIPHTREITNLRDRRPGDRVNLEADMLGKWIGRLLPGTER